VLDYLLVDVCPVPGAGADDFNVYWRARGGPGTGEKEETRAESDKRIGSRAKYPNSKLFLSEGQN
jgi:hypothetical protein